MVHARILALLPLEYGVDYRLVGYIYSYIRNGAAPVVAVVVYTK
jgi:hypothetical protein